MVCNEGALTVALDKGKLRLQHSKQNTASGQYSPIIPISSEKTDIFSTAVQRGTDIFKIFELSVNVFLGLPVPDARPNKHPGQE